MCYFATTIHHSIDPFQKPHSKSLHPCDDASIESRTSDEMSASYYVPVRSCYLTGSAARRNNPTPIDTANLKDLFRYTGARRRSYGWLTWRWRWTPRKRSGTGSGRRGGVDNRHRQPGTPGAPGFPHLVRHSPALVCTCEPAKKSPGEGKSNGIIIRLV